MQTQVTKRLDFFGKKVSIGLEVHKKSWRVTVLVDGIEHRIFNQPPEPQRLVNYLHRMFPNGEYQSAYEAGFCGYFIHRNLLKAGIDNRVIIPSDIPGNQKEMLGKTDYIDNRKIARSLDHDFVRGIHVFEPPPEELRIPNRTRINLRKDFRRSKNRIKSLLYYFGITLPNHLDNNHWSLEFEKWIEQLSFNDPAGKEALFQLMATYRYFKQQMLDINRQLRKFIKVYDRQLYELLMTIPGIGPLTAIPIITEQGDINRFNHLNHLFVAFRK